MHIYPRYERHAELVGFGEAGQNKLFQSKILIVGAGGLGCPVLLYLTCAGVGTITCADNDVIHLGNLQRQVLYKTHQAGLKKTDIAKKEVHERNPDVTINIMNNRIDESNASKIIKEHDLVIDCSDNFNTRYLLNQFCFAHRTPLVSGSVIYFEGQISTFKPWQGDDHPCYECLYPYHPQSHEAPTCADSAVLSPLPGVIGTLMAVEAIKELVGIGESLSGKLLSYSGLTSKFDKMQFNKRTDCNTCGEQRHSSQEISRGTESCQIKRS